ncbi:MAG: transketolase C-terminal domain-containing protein [Chloroflexota bacterium]
MNRLLPPFDWQEAARVSLSSRLLDELEESELNPRGEVPYQFSARGHELGQALLAQLLDRPGDAASVYYRSRPFMLGSGLTLEEALAAGMARQGSPSGGRDVGVVFNMPARGRATVLPMAGDVGSQYTPAAGWAQALCYRVQELGETELESSVTVVFGGEGSVATNGFWSALTIATTLELPLLFVIEDNGYAISVEKWLQTPGGDIAGNLDSFDNLQVWQGSGTEPEETAELVRGAVEYVRGWQGPGLLRLTVPRLSGHSSHDNQTYKPQEVLEQERARDPLPALRRYLVPALYDEEGWTELEREIEEEVQKAREAASAQPEPDPADVATHVWKAPAGVEANLGNQRPQPPEPRRINMIEAIRRTLDVELARNPRLLVFGEDVGRKGGVHTATLGLQSKYGERRVFDTSLSEEGIIGRAVGMALAGLQPAPEIQFRKYADPATEQLRNCGTLRWRTANRFAAPIVVRMPGGFGRKVGDPWHSMTGEVDFAHTVGWRVAFPSNAEDAVGLLRSALWGDDPVIFFEHRAQMDAAWARRPYPGDEYVVPFGRARLIREGGDLTVVTWGAMVERCEQAAQAVGDGVEIVDLRTIVPWDRDAVRRSLQKTSKCLVVHEDVQSAGFGAEIVATIMEEMFFYLDAPVRRVASPSVPVPFNYNLMQAVVPSVADIREAMEELLAF